MGVHNNVLSPSQYLRVSNHNIVIFIENSPDFSMMLYNVLIIDFYLFLLQIRK